MFFPMLAIHQFQSTHPARGATERGRGKTWEHPYFNPRTPRGVRPRASSMSPVRLTISIHAPREGCDRALLRAGRAAEISIHAPREGCDLRRAAQEKRQDDFNPRTPRGVRPPSTPGYTHSHPGFQSTHPARGATSGVLIGPSPVLVISIHAPREGCDGRVLTFIDVLSHISIHAPREGCDHGCGSQYI